MDVQYESICNLFKGKFWDIYLRIFLRNSDLKNVPKPLRKVVVVVVVGHEMWDEESVNV